MKTGREVMLGFTTAIDQSESRTHVRMLFRPNKFRFGIIILARFETDTSIVMLEVFKLTCLNGTTESIRIQENPFVIKRMHLASINYRPDHILQKSMSSELRHINAN